MGGPTPGRWSWRRRTGTSTRNELLLFVGVGLVTLVAVSTGTVVASEQFARRYALAEAERTTVRIADLLVSPLIHGFLTGEPGARATFERVVANRLRDELLRSLIIWDADGRVVYSSVDELEGEEYEPSDELRMALTGTVTAAVDEAPETSYELNVAGPVLEVYVPIPRIAQPLVLEVYFDHAVIEQVTNQVRNEILPIALGGLVLLQLVQIPIAASLAARVRRHDVDRAALIERNLDESDRERRVIAADLHDGPVQDLAGVSYALSALRGAVPADRQPTMDRLLDAVRRAVASLRQVMIDVYPPELSGEGLPQAVQALADRLRDQGIEVHLDSGELPPMASPHATALYRAAKESLANVGHHAGATQVWVTLTTVDGAGPARVRLVVADDGVGFPSDRNGRIAEGHLGLHFMALRLAELGGRVEFGSRPGGGATVTAEVPVDSVG